MYLRAFYWVLSPEAICLVTCSIKLRNFEVCCVVTLVFLKGYFPTIIMNISELLDVCYTAQLTTYSRTGRIRQFTTFSQRTSVTMQPDHQTG